MSTESVAPSSPSSSSAGTNFTRLLVIILLAIMLLWYFGAFKRKPRVAIVVGEGPYFDLVLSGAREAERQYDATLTVVRVKGDQQGDAIRALVDQGYDGVAVSPFNPPAEAAILSDLSATTTLVTFDSDAPTSNRLCFVGTDNYAAGRLAGQQARAVAPSGEVLLLVGSLDKENLQRRRQGVIDELVDRPFEPSHPMDPADAPVKGEGDTVVVTVIDAGDPDAVVASCAKALKEHPNTKVCVGLNAASPARLVKAIEQAGQTGKVAVIGFDASSATLEGIEAGQIAATILQDQFGSGFHAVRILAEKARGDASGMPMFQRRTLPVEIVNKENVASVRAQLAGNGRAATTAPAPTTVAGS